MATMKAKSTARKVNVKVSKGKAVKPVAKVTKARAEHKPLASFVNVEKGRIKSIALDAMREGSKVWRRFKALKAGMSIAKAIEAGVSEYDLATAAARGRVTFAK